MTSTAERPLFGSLAVGKGHCTPDELDVALDAQKGAEPTPRIGEVLVDMGKLTPEQVASLLEEQRAKLPGSIAPHEPCSAMLPGNNAQEARPESKLKVVLGKVHAGVAKLLPFLHQHRTYALLAMLPGLFAIVLPWRLLTSGRWVHGVQGPGWLSSLLLGAAGGWLLAGDRPKPITRTDRLVLLALSGAAVLAGLWKLFSAPEGATALGVGIPLAFVSSLLLHGIAWPMKAVDGDPERTPLARLKRAWRDVSGKRAKEKKELLERRDALLKSIGEAALASPPAEDEPPPVQAARQAVAAPPGPKPVPGKRERAILRLGRALVDADRTPQAGEVRELDERLARC